MSRYSGTDPLIRVCFKIPRGDLMRLDKLASRAMNRNELVRRMLHAQLNVAEANINSIIDEIEKEVT